jgi:hypothetical protein
LAKFLLIPILILAFIVFLAVLGAIGLGIAFIILATVGKAWRLVSGVGRAGRRVSRRGGGQQT